MSRSQWREWLREAGDTAVQDAVPLLACVSECMTANASDAHVIGGNPIGFRVGGRLLPKRTWQAQEPMVAEWTVTARSLADAAGIPSSGVEVTERHVPGASPEGLFRIVTPSLARVVAMLLITRECRASLDRLEEALNKLDAGLERDGVYDFTAEITLAPRLRARISVQLGRAGYCIILRALPQHRLSLDQLGFNREVLIHLKSVSRRQSGLVLFVGSVNSGKSTSMHAMLNHASAIEPRKIVTIEDPVELDQPQFGTASRSLVQQREVGADLRGFAAGLVHSLRADGEVILIGEIRDEDSMRAAIHAAQAGHLVYASMHAGSFMDALDNVARFFPKDRREAGLISFARNLAAIVYQDLLSSAGSDQMSAKAEHAAGGRIPAYENWLQQPDQGSRRTLVYEFVLGTPEIRQLIRNFAVQGTSFMMSTFLDEIQRSPHVSFPRSIDAARLMLSPDRAKAALDDYHATLPGEATRRQGV